MPERREARFKQAMKAYQGIQYRADAEVAMVEQRMTLKYRVPDKQRLEWAQRIVAAMGDRRCLASSQKNLAQLAAERGDAREARRLFVESLRVRHEFDDELGVAEYRSSSCLLRLTLPPETVL